MDHDGKGLGASEVLIPAISVKLVIVPSVLKVSSVFMAPSPTVGLLRVS